MQITVLNLLNLFFENFKIYYNFYKKINNLIINIIIFSKFIKIINFFFKYNSFFFKTMLIDINTFDYNKNFYINKKNLNFNCILFLYYNYNYNFKFNLITFTNLNNNIFSIENIFINSNWIERELSELYGIFFLQKKDIRNLLLDYNFINNPFLKKFPICGYIEINFNFLKNWIFYNNIILKESNNINFLYS